MAHLRWPFVGREAELEHVAQALATRRGVVLVGDAGVGKSRVLGEAVERAAASGLRVLHVRATRSSGVVPLGAFAPLLPVDDAAASLARAREAILARAPAVLAIDDAHALDEASAALAHQLVTQDGVQVLATVRLGEDVPDAIVGLWKDGLCERLDLDPLTRDALDRLVVSALGGPVDARFGHLMWTRSLGNVLYARELLGAAVETGALTRGRRHLDADRAVHRSPAAARADRRAAPGRAARGADRPRPPGPGRAAARGPAGRDRRRAEPRAPRGAGTAGGGRLGPGGRPAEPPAAGRRPARLAGPDPAAPPAAGPGGGGVGPAPPGRGERPGRRLAHRRRAWTSRPASCWPRRAATPWSTRRWRSRSPAGPWPARAATRRPP